MNEANSRDHWTTKAKRHKKQSHDVTLALSVVLKDHPLPCKIKLTRIAPRKLDQWDNLPMAFKWILDAIASIIIPGKAKGQADSDSRLQVEYDQMKGYPREYSILVEVFEYKDPVQ